MRVSRRIGDILAWEGPGAASLPLLYRCGSSTQRLDCPLRAPAPSRRPARRPAARGGAGALARDHRAGARRTAAAAVVTEAAAAVDADRQREPAFGLEPKTSSLQVAHGAFSASLGVDARVVYSLHLRWFLRLRVERRRTPRDTDLGRDVGGFVDASTLHRAQVDPTERNLVTVFGVGVAPLLAAAHA